MERIFSTANTAPTSTSFWWRELLIVFAIIALLLSIQLKSSVHHIVKTKVVETHMAANAPAEEIGLYYMLHGEWPPAFDLSTHATYQEFIESSSVIQSIMFDGKGGLHLTLTGHRALEAQVVSYRAATSIHSAVASIIWLCGDAPVPAGYQAEAVNQTTLEKSLLTFSCR